MRPNSRPQSRACARSALILAFSDEGLTALRFIAAADRPPLAGDGHCHRLAPVAEACFVHKDCDALLSRQGVNQVLAGFRHVDAGIGDETAQPGLHGVGDSHERHAARDGVEGAGFRLGYAKAEGGEDFGSLRFGSALLIWLVQWYNGFGWLTSGSSLRVCYRHKDGALSSASQPFLM